MTKFTYKTQEVANILGVTKKTLLNWLRAEKVPEPRRNDENNYRIWTAEDIALIQQIRRELLEESGR